MFDDRCPEKITLVGVTFRCDQKVGHDGKCYNEPEGCGGTARMTWIPIKPNGRFDHHPDPAIDYLIEVDAIAGLVEDVRAGIQERRPVEDRIFKASMFRVGADVRCVEARRKLLELESEVGTL